MAYDVNKLTKLGALKQMAQRIAADYATKEEVAASINAKVSSAYTAGGCAAFDALPGLTEENVGLVVNVTDGFTTTDSFIEGAGAAYPAGTNVVVVKSGEEYKYDALSGFVDLSGYVEKEDGKGLSANDFTDADKEKLDGIEEHISDAVARATTTYDDGFARNFGASTDESGKVHLKFEISGYSKVANLTIPADTKIQAITKQLQNHFKSGGYALNYDETSGQILVTKNNEPVEFIITDTLTETELTGTPPERFGPVFSFNGRSGVVVPQAGDYTPEMVGVTIAADEEVTEMLAEVFGAAE